MTEQPPRLHPVARHFPARNRIVSGLSAGVVVIEAAHRSGTLITARCAADQGREVMAVPGHPIDARASGCNALIRDGATLVRNAEDVLAVIGLAAEGAGDGVATGSQEAAAVGQSAGGVMSRDASPEASLNGQMRALPAGGASSSSSPTNDARDLGALRQQLLALLSPSPTDEDGLIRDLDVAPARLAPVILDLELEGTVIRMPGGRIALAG